MQASSRAITGGTSRDNPITIPLDVAPTLPVEPNRTASNTRHLYSQPASKTPITPAQISTNDATHTKPRDDATNPPQSLFQAQISDPASQPITAHQQSNGAPQGVSISPARTSASIPAPRTPASVNKKLLARDILRSFGRGDILSSLGEKRKRSEERQIHDVSDKRAREQSSASSAPISSSVPANDTNVTMAEPQTVQGNAELGEVDKHLIETVVSSPRLSPITSADAQSEVLLPVPGLPTVGTSIIATATVTGTPPVAGPSIAKEPLFLPSPGSSTHHVEATQTPESDENNRSHMYKTHYMPHPVNPDEIVDFILPSRTYVQVPVAPEWVRLYKHRLKISQDSNYHQLQPPTREVLEISDSEDEIEQWDGEGANPSQLGSRIRTDGKNLFNGRRVLSLMEVAHTKRKSGGKMVGDRPVLL